MPQGERLTAVSHNNIMNTRTNTNQSWIRLLAHSHGKHCLKRSWNHHRTLICMRSVLLLHLNASATTHPPANTGPKGPSRATLAGRKVGPDWGSKSGPPRGPHPNPPAAPVSGPKIGPQNMPGEASTNSWWTRGRAQIQDRIPVPKTGATSSA